MLSEKWDFKYLEIHNSGQVFQEVINILKCTEALVNQARTLIQCEGYIVAALQEGKP